MLNFDFLIKGSNLQAVILAYYLQLTGKKVIITTKNDFCDTLSTDPFFILENISEKTANYLYNSAANIFIPIQKIEFDIKKSSLKQVSNFFMCKTGINKAEYSNKKILELTEPLLKKSNYKYGIIKHTYKYQHHRLCMEFLLSAKQNGAYIFNYSEPVSYDNKHFKIKYLEKEIKFTAKQIIHTNKTNTTQHTQKLLAIPRYRFELRNTMNILGKDFSLQLIPNFATVIIKSSTKISNQQILQLINQEFNKQLSKNDILEEQVLNNTQKTQIIFNDKNIYIGDADIEQALLNTEQFIKENINNSFNIYNTKADLFYNFDFDKTTETILDKVESGYREMEQIGLQPGAYTQLFYRYGKHFLELADIAFEYYHNLETREYAWLIAEIIYSKKNEYTLNFNDFYYKRSNLHYSHFFNSNLKEKAKALFYTY